MDKATLGASLQFQKELCEILGLDPVVTRNIQLDLEAGGLTMIHVMQYITDTQATKITRLVRRATWEQITLVTVPAEYMEETST